MNVVLVDEIPKQLCRIATPVLYGRRQAEVIGAAGKDAATTVFADQEKLGHNLFPGLFGRQTVPPRKPADVEQLGTIVENVGAADPGDLVAHHAAIACEPLLQVQWI